MRELFDTSGPGRFEGESPLAAYLDARIDQADEQAGSVEFSGHAARFGRRVLTTSSSGFVSLTKYETVEAAIAVLAVYADGMAAYDEAQEAWFDYDGEIANAD